MFSRNGNQALGFGLGLFMALFMACGGGEGESPALGVGGKADTPEAAADRHGVDEDQPKRKWTMMVYAAADNNLAPYLAGALNEMEKTGSSDEVNLVAFIDLPGDTNGLLFYLVDDGDLVQVTSPAWAVNNGQEVDSGNPESLVSMVQWAFDKFPADKYGLIVAGHGGGTPRVIAPDDSSGGTISVPQLFSALKKIKSKTGKKLEFLGANACLMQTLETAYELRNTTKALVASELVQLSSYSEATGIDNGWPYDKMARNLVNQPSISGTSLAKLIVRDYEDAVNWGMDSSLSAVDPSKVSKVGREVSQLATALFNYVSEAPETRVDQVMGALYSTYYYSTDDYQDRNFIDLGDLQKRLADYGVTDRDVVYEMADVLLSIDSMTLGRVVSKGAYDAGAKGISIYYPRDGTVFQGLSDYTSTYSFAQKYDWDGFLRNFYNMFCDVHSDACSAN
jgi:hypothetical protein